MPVLKYLDPTTSQWVPLPTAGPTGPTGPAGGGSAGGDITASRVRVETASISHLELAITGNGERFLVGLNGTTRRWAMALGDTALETGADVGSNFALYAYSDTGQLNATVLTVDRATGTLHVLQDAEVLGILTASTINLNTAGTAQIKVDPAIDPTALILKPPLGGWINASDTVIGAVHAPINAADAATKQYVDDRIQAGVGQTDAAGAARIVFSPPYSAAPVVVGMAMGSASFLIAPSGGNALYCDVNLYSHAGALTAAYFYWIAVPATV